MRADIHDGQEHKRSVQGPDTEAQDLSPPNHHFPLATRGRSIQKCQEETSSLWCGYMPLVSSGIESYSGFPGGATWTPRKPPRSIARCTKPDALASSIN